MGKLKVFQREPCIKNNVLGLLLPVFMIASLAIKAPIYSQEKPLLGKEYQLKKVISVEGRQGIAANKDYYFVSGSKALYKYDKNGKLLMKNENPFEGISKEVNHLGDIDIKGDSIIAGVEFFDSGKAKNLQIAIYNSHDLPLKETLEFDNMEQSEIAGVCVGDKNTVWMVDWIEGFYIYKYDVENKEYMGKLHLQPSPQWQQGCVQIDEKILITADDGDADFPNQEYDHVYFFDLPTDIRTTAVEVMKFRQMDDFKRSGEIEGISYDPETGDLVVLNNRGARIVKGMPSGFYSDYDEEIHEIYIYQRL